ncbi:MAG: phosphatase PAP2 family protein [Achromobacter sp.]|jgi:acid phosphatase (class A)|uniref:Acid phosphatase n=1 Tax=Achromobacter insuavis TaxID=1287735 RepID=A0A6J4ZM70_9BURK|nr:MULTISPECIES: phosphatase PAP2 family protein [Achromobacter]MBN9637910.1 phosphatase PAP2 family protein [Achromobacter sp.]CAB3636273.1 Major phosphate-irrepressible acid phosphatase [Achromobacter insuavis]CUI67052.1 Major phosphate-irrepressible acid phosphatase precursor [Achromobacter sp. 2789STDY5608628]CUI79840.1 Major phosphate-irrepressible acid phosphatase precursor [Achromobacter sp. 2789STDY5608633]
MLAKLRRKAGCALFLSLGIGAALASGAGNEPDPAITDPHFQLAPGYLPKERLPDSLELLGPPPAAASAALARDEEARAATVPLRNSARATLARLDADLQFPQPARSFSCAMGFAITEVQTPHLYRLMQKVLTDAGLSTYGVKNTYNRARPFVVHDEGTCFPEQEPLLRKDGSYPSGHTAAGWAWALVLAEVNPERANRLLRRGLEFGQSRVICNAHWQSDVDAGRTMGAATVALLRDNAEFVADLNGARQEVRAMQVAGSAPGLDCAAEEAALSQPR